MQHDEVIWQTIRHSSCSFMSKIETGNFCRNPYNVTGICNRSSCPLANSRYATIRADKGVFYLYMKSIERAHLPNKLWERVKLPKNYLEALEVIDKHLMFWPMLLVHKVKQRLTKLTQMRIRMRKLELKTSEKLMTMPSKITKLDARRLEKAEKAALIDKRIEEELVYRHLKYDGEWHGVPGHNEDIIYENTDKELVEYVEADEDLEEEDDMEDYGNYMTIGDDEVELEEDNDEDMIEVDTKLSAKLKKPVIIEVEHEGGSSRQKQTSVY